MKNLPTAADFLALGKLPLKELLKKAIFSIQNVQISQTVCTTTNVYFNNSTINVTHNNINIGSQITHPLNENSERNEVIIIDSDEEMKNNHFDKWHKNMIKLTNHLWEIDLKNFNESKICFGCLKRNNCQFDDEKYFLS